MVEVFWFKSLAVTYFHMGTPTLSPALNCFTSEFESRIGWFTLANAAGQTDEECCHRQHSHIRKTDFKVYAIVRYKRFRCLTRMALT
jgi:hypothetical protein